MLLAGALVVVVVAVGLQVVMFSNAVNRLQGATRELELTLNIIGSKNGTDLTLNDFERLRVSVGEVSAHLSTVKATAQPVRPLAASLNTEWAVSLQGLDIAEHLLLSVQDMLAGIEPALFFMVNGQSDETVAAQISSGERIIELMTIGQVRFNQARGHLDTARTLLDNLALAGVSESLFLQIREISTYYDLLDNTNTVLRLTPDLLSQMLGVDETQRYLILAQNSDELRPSGGYISTYGWMTVRNGRITDYDYFPTTAETPDPPPDQYARLVSVPDWWIQYGEPLYAMWDGSWYADFPQTAEMARRYYNLGADNDNTPIDGVIAIDVRGFEMVLGALGSVGVDRTINGQTDLVTITPDNFREVVYNVRAFGDGLRPHKAFVADVYETIFSDWQRISRSADTSQQLLGILVESLLQKHIMLYFDDPEINAVLNILGWSGQQAPAEDYDYLMVADANLGNKSNRSIIRQLTYDVVIAPDETLSGRAAINYDYSDIIARDDPAIDARFHGPVDYNNLMQVFVPVRAELTASDNFGATPLTVPYPTHTIFVSRVRIPYDTAQRYQLSYTLPDLIDQVGPYQRYRLLLQKQPGSLPMAVSFQMSLPAGTHIVSASPEPDAIFDIENLILDYRIDLTADQWFEIIYQQPG